MKLRTILGLLVIISICSLAQELRVTQRGNTNARRVGKHDGNEVLTIFTNYGVIAQPSTLVPRGAWRYENNGYVGDISPVIGLLLPPYLRKVTADSSKIDTLHTVITTPVERPSGHGGKYGNGGKSWNLEPIPGFFNPAINQNERGVAMSHQPDTWPASWPNQPAWTFSELPIYDPATKTTIIPSVDWNGYFGRGTGRIASQESYWWMDDNNDEQFTQLIGFRPDANDSSRSGKAIQVECRGLQWGDDPVAQNTLFWLYNIKNDGTTDYDQAVFGTLVGTYVGGAGTEWNDDCSFFDVRNAITYSWDFDHLITGDAAKKWLPDPTAVGYIAYAFLESPGNGYDGIDNDHDNSDFTAAPTLAKRFTEADFKPRLIKTGDKVIKITVVTDPITQKKEYVRDILTVGSVPMDVVTMGHTVHIIPGTTVLTEGAADTLTGKITTDAFDGWDNNLNGLIDENYQVHYRQLKKSPAGVTLLDTINATQYKDYINGVGLTDRMIDERRDNGIDDNLNWNRKTDDVGQDGKAGTHDLGEGDGIPTAGEPNFDKTDVNESDQLGLTSFYYFVPAGDLIEADNETMWTDLRPGFYDVPLSVINNVATRGEDGDFMYGSGYFPLLAGTTERFSLALAFGIDYYNVLKTKKVVQIIYNNNYTFASPPETPTLTVVPGDNRVTLYWDRVAEASIDNITHEQDFEGYKIFRSNAYDFKDINTLTDGSGNPVGWEPLKLPSGESAQLDLKNGIKGYFPLSPTERELYDGFSFFLGTDRGIVNSFVDSNVVNGRPYFYAIVSYDRGVADSNTTPKQNTFKVSRNSLGEYTFAKNTALVIPNRQSVGYQPPPAGKKSSRLSGASTGGPPTYELVDQYKVKNATYYVTFQDTLIPYVKGVGDTVKEGPFAKGYAVTDSATGKVLINSTTKITASNGIVFDGIRLSFDTTYQNLDSIRLNRTNSFWNHPIKYPGRDGVSDTISALRISDLLYDDPANKVHTSKVAPDFALVFSNEYKDSSNNLDYLIKDNVPISTKLNFKLFDISDPANPKRAKFIIVKTSGVVDTLKSNDFILLSDTAGSKLYWQILFLGKPAYAPTLGDTLFLKFNKPYNSTDKFTFRMETASFNRSLAKSQLSAIRAVPNPYIGTNMFETPPAPGLQGRGPRVITFTGVPPGSKIHIYTSSGNHVRTLEMTGTIFDGAVNWDLRTKEGLEVAYGVYFYVVEVEGTGEKKTGKLAIIK